MISCTCRKKAAGLLFFLEYDGQERNEFGEESNNIFPTSKESESIFDYLSNISLHW